MPWNTDKQMTLEDKHTNPQPLKLTMIVDPLNSA